MKIKFVALAALVLGAAGGFAVGMSLRPNAEPVEAKTETPAVSEDAARLAKAQKRIAELERSLAAAKRAAAALKDAKPVKSALAPTNSAERVIAVEGDGKDVLDALKGQLSHEEFSQVTNAMTQMRARLAEKAKGRMEFLASINLDGMSADERKNHAKFLELMERREAAAAKMKGGIPDAATIQKLVELEV